MTIDECARTVTREVRQAVNRAYFRKTEEPEILPPVIAALRALVFAESVRGAGIFNQYVQARSDAWGPGASNPPKASDYRNEILGTSPGRKAKR